MRVKTAPIRLNNRQVVDPELVEELTEDAAAWNRVRLAVAQALGLGDGAQLSTLQLASAVERICAAATDIPALALLSRDLK